MTSFTAMVGMSARQQAPSAIRCIKTAAWSTMPVTVPCVRKHRAPYGALRPTDTDENEPVVEACQKAPSAIRCIKTWSSTPTRT